MNPAILLIIIFLVSTTPSYSTEKVHFSANYMEYNQELNLIILKEEAAISGPDFHIRAENLQYNIGTGDVQAREKIRLFRKDELVEGENIVYNTHTDEGRVNEFQSISQNTFIKGDEAQISPRKNTLINGCFTTCEHEHPHYRITAREMILIPNQALLLKNASFYLGNRKLFSMPAYRFDLRQGYIKSPLLLLPGYDRSRGFYVKTAWSFLLDEKNYGEVKITPTARQGADLSLELFLNDGTAHPTNISFTKQENRSTGNVTHRMRILQELNTEKHGNFQLDSSYLWDKQRSIGMNKEFNYSSTWNRQFHSGANIRLEFTGREDPDRNAYTADNNMRYMEKMPALNIESATMKPDNLPLQYRYGGKWSYLKEKNPNTAIKTQDRELYTNIFADTIQSGGAVTSMNMQIRANEYSSGDDRQYYRFNLNSAQNLGKGFNIQSNYHKHQVYGDNPFLSWDKLRSSENITERLNYAGKKFSATIFQFNYNIKNNIFSGSSSYFHYNSAINGIPWSIGLQTVYRQHKNNSLQNMKIDNTFANLHFQKSMKESLTLRGHYSNINTKWESFGSEMKFFGGRQHYLEVGTHYNAISREFTRIRLGLIKDLDCMEGRVEWDFRQKEFTLQVYLKQGSSVGFGLKVDYENQFSVRPELPDIDGG
jgi:hypothetical protein